DTSSFQCLSGCWPIRTIAPECARPRAQKRSKYHHNCCARGRAHSVWQATGYAWFKPPRDGSLRSVLLRKRSVPELLSHLIRIRATTSQIQEAEEGGLWQYALAR